jgi:hypothetical protein
MFSPFDRRDSYLTHHYIDFILPPILKSDVLYLLFDFTKATEAFSLVHNLYKEKMIQPFYI